LPVPRRVLHIRYRETVPIEITVEEVQRLLREESAVFIEVLPRREYLEEHLPGARNVPLKELTADAVADVERSQPVIMYCHDDL
jgi:rhodanese-related sulfurtransferase